MPKAINEMVRQLREGRGLHGLVLANGGVVTYEHTVCLSSQSPKPGWAYPVHNSPIESAVSVPSPEIELHPSGLGVIEVSSTLPIHAHISPVIIRRLMLLH